MDLSNDNSHCSLREKQTILEHRAASCVFLLSKHVPTIGFDMETRVNEIHEAKTNEAVMVARSNSRFKDEHRVFCSEQATRCIVFFSRLEPQMILSIFYFFFFFFHEEFHARPETSLLNTKLKRVFAISFPFL